MVNTNYAKCEKVYKHFFHDCTSDSLESLSSCGKCQNIEALGKLGQVMSKNLFLQTISN